MWRRAAVVIAVLCASRAAHASVVVFDYTDDPLPAAASVADGEADALIQRFPHPHAAPGKTCDPNSPGTPRANRIGGLLRPVVTSVTGAFSQPGASETAYLIDYCMTGIGQPRTRRLLVLDTATTAIVIDREMPIDAQATEVLAAVDVDGDGRAELVVTDRVTRGDRSLDLAFLVRPTARGLTVLGSWTAHAGCTPSEYHDEQIGHRVTAVTTAHGLAFRDDVVTRHCFYRPAPP